MVVGAAVATSSITELVKGKTTGEALKVTNKAVGGLLDGLPPVKVLFIVMEEAIHAALWDYAEKMELKIEGLENQNQIFMKMKKR